MFKFLRYKDLCHILLNSPSVFGADSIESLSSLLEGFHIGIRNTNEVVLYIFNPTSFNSWLAFKSNLMKKADWTFLYKEYFNTINIDIYKKGNQILYSDLIREYMSIEPSKIYKDKNDDSMIFVIYYNSILPWRIIQIDNEGVLQEYFTCTCTFRKNSIKETTLKKKYLQRCKKLINNVFSKDLDTDFISYNLKDFMGNYYYRDYKAKYSIYSNYEESAK